MAFRATVRHAPTTASAPQSLRLFQKLWQLRNIYCDSPRRVTSEQFGGLSPPQLVLEINIRKLLPVVVPHDEAGVQFLDRPRAAESGPEEEDPSGPLVGREDLVGVVGGQSRRANWG